MCRKIITSHPCAHEEESFKPCKAWAVSGFSKAGHCNELVSWRENSYEPCDTDGCKWVEYGGIWRCCQCRKAPNRVAVCRWKDKTGPCEHVFCEQCLPVTSRTTKASKK